MLSPAQKPASAFPVPPSSDTLQRSQNAVAPRPAFPPMSFGISAVTPSEHVASGTRLYTTIGYLFIVGAVIVATLSTMGGFLLLLGIGWVAAWFQARRVRALIRGSGVQVTPSQLPELHALVESFAKRVGLKQTPEVYILEDGAVNGFAMKVGKRDTLILTDDAVWGALQSKDPRVLAFIIGHELGHIAHGHTTGIRAILNTAFPPLARADEFSADNVAAALVGDTDVAVRGVAMLAVGPQLLSYLNEDALKQQAAEVNALKLSKKVEKTMRHPLALRRVANVARS